MTFAEVGASAVIQIVLRRGVEQGLEGLLNGVDVNATSLSGQTALQNIANAGTSGGACADLLLLFGANIDSVDIHGNTPLHAAALAGNASLVKTLKTRGADMQRVNNAGKTALDLAKRHNEVAELLGKGLQKKWYRP